MNSDIESCFVLGNLDGSFRLGSGKGVKCRSILSGIRFAPREVGSKGHFLSQADKVGFLDSLSKVLGINEFRQGLAELVNGLEWSVRLDGNTNRFSIQVIQSGVRSR